MLEKYWKNTMIFPWWETSNHPWAPLSKLWKPKNGIQHTDQHQETRNIDSVKPGVYCDTSGAWCLLSLKVLPGGCIFCNSNVCKEWRNLRSISGLSWSYSVMEPKAEQAGDLVTWNAGSWDKEDSAWRHLPCFTLTSTSLCFFQIFSSPCCFWAHPHRAEHGKDKTRECTSAHSPDVGGEENASVQSCSRPDFCQLCAWVTNLIQKTEMGNAANGVTSLTMCSLKLLTFLFCLLTALDIGLPWFSREGKEVSSCGERRFLLVFSVAV